MGNPLNQAPTADVQAEPDGRQPPAGRALRRGAARDPDPGDVLRYAWDLDGDGQLDDSSAARPSFTYTTGGTYTVTLRVTDTSGASDTETLTVSVTSGPAATITAPATGTTWRAGDVIAFAGSATDVEDGTLPGTGLDWVAVVRDCATPETCHEHPIAEFHDTASGSFTAPDHPDPAQIELQLTATDSGGETDTKQVTLQPRTAQLAVDSAPAGAQVSVDDRTARCAVHQDGGRELDQHAVGAVDPDPGRHLAPVLGVGRRPGADARREGPGHGRHPPGRVRLDRARPPDADVRARGRCARRAAQPGHQLRLGQPDRQRQQLRRNFQSYLRFLVGGISGNVTSAKLRLRATSATVNGPVVFGSPDDWSESAITWANRPGPTPARCRTPVRSPPSDWVEWDVTAAVTADGARSFRLASAVNDGVSFNSRESSKPAFRPQLVVSVTNGGYPRPKGASPVRFPLVPAYERCDSPNRLHGAPLDHPSCAPPVPSSPALTIGTPDANGSAAAFAGYATFEVLNGNPATTDDEADVRLQVALSDVRNADLSDYAGELQARTVVRVTDRAGGPLTLADLVLPATVPCSATGAAAGATCGLSTTLDALTPGLVDEGARAIWELGGFEVLDGTGAIFARPGVFVP